MIRLSSKWTTAPGVHPVPGYSGIGESAMEHKRFWLVSDIISMMVSIKLYDWHVIRVSISMRKKQSNKFSLRVLHSIGLTSQVESSG